VVEVVLMMMRRRVTDRCGWVVVEVVLMMRRRRLADREWWHGESSA